MAATPGDDAMGATSYPSQYFIVPPPAGEKRERKTKASPNPQPEVFISYNPPAFTEEKIREVLADWVQTKPLLSPSAVRGMVLTSVTQEVAYLYKMETFTEQRSVCWRYKPHSEGSICQPHTEEEPKEARPWKVSVPPAVMFSEQVFKSRLANTDRVTGCPSCKGEKWLLCAECRGSTRRRCKVCKGRKEGAKKTCAGCKGERTVPCRSCMGLGRQCCDMCVGEGQLCYFKELRVDYCCHGNFYLCEVPGGIPEELMVNAVAQVLHTTTGPKIQPITSFRIKEVNAASRRTLEAARWPDRRIVQQRQVLRAVPITRVQYRWRNTAGSVYIYGCDCAIYWPDPPWRRVQISCPCC